MCQCRKKGLGKIRRELGSGVDGRGLRKSGRSGLGVLEFIWSFSIGIVKLLDRMKNGVCGVIIRIHAW